MKKTILSIAVIAAAFVAASCQKENLQENTAPEGNASVFTATIENGASTKTTVERVTSSSVAYKTKWEDTDKISINGVTYTATPDDTDKTKATFNKTSGVDPTAPFHAYFPASMYSDSKAALPETYDYEDGKYNMPMYAESDNTTLSFKNLCAVLAIKVTSDDITTLKAIKVASDKKMNGTFTVSDNKAVVGTDGTNVLVLESSTALTLNADGTTFYIAIPAQNYMYLNIYLSSDGETYTRAMATKKAAGLGDIARSKMFSIDYETNAFQLYANGPYFADRNVGASSATDVGSKMTFVEARKTGSDYVWGANWCTPSKPKMDELLKAATNDGSEKVKCEIVREGNVETGKIISFKFTGKETGYTGNSVFFPAESGDSYGSYAEYWSSTPYKGKAWDMYLEYHGGDWNSSWYDDYQDDEYLVRPVLVN